MLASVIIPAYNAEATLARCIEACLAQTGAEMELIVVDDGSTDATPRIAQAFPVHYVHQDNRGPAAARNRGAACARGDVFVYTDADCVPEHDWLESLLRRFDEAVAAVGGTYALANAESLLARMIHHEIAARHSRFGQEIDFLGSFNVAYRRDAFEAVHGFDEAFRRASAEDNDLAYRLLDHGYRLAFAPDARVAHFHPTRLFSYLRTQMRHGFWRVRLYRKHPGRMRRGDRYAGPADLAAPPVALLLLAAAPLLLVLTFAAPGLLGNAAAATGALATVGLLLHLPLALTMIRSARDPRLALFLPVALLRDIARALGMLGGFARFAFGPEARP